MNLLKFYLVVIFSLLVSAVSYAKFNCNTVFKDFSKVRSLLSQNAISSEISYWSHLSIENKIDLLKRKFKNKSSVNDLTTVIIKKPFHNINNSIYKKQIEGMASIVIKYADKSQIVEYESYGYKADGPPAPHLVYEFKINGYLVALGIGVVQKTTDSRVEFNVMSLFEFNGTEFRLLALDIRNNDPSEASFVNYKYLTLQEYLKTGIN